MKHYHRIMELFWLVTAVFTVFFAVYIIYKVGFAEGWLIITLPAISILLFFMRRYARKKHEDDGLKK